MGIFSALLTSLTKVGYFLEEDGFFCGVDNAIPGMLQLGPFNRLPEFYGSPLDFEKMDSQLTSVMYACDPVYL